MTYVAPQFRCFSAEQHARLIELFGVHDREAHALLFDLLRDISSLHSRWRDMPPAVDEPIESHRKRLTGISKSARYLARELGREPLLYSLLLEDLCAGDQAHFRAAIHEADRWEEDVAHVLGGIARAADRLAKDPGALRLARFDPEAPNVARKEIWEPVLALLRELKIPIGFSKTGPVVEIINIIHEALSLEVPRLESVRTAIKEFKEGAARKRRGARTSKKIRLFESFILRAMAGDDEMVRFVQRVFGYALTGSTREHALFFCYGTGANGKSVLLSTMAGVMGDYHRTAPIDTFTASSGDRHPTDLAGLRGARLVTAVETEEGRRWAEGRIKTLTGGDPLAARFMRQDFFEFVPQFKLVIAGNHKPALRSIDEAIRRRFHLVPFTVTIPPDERDQDLAEKLKCEWPGILAWMIKGCLEWQERGLEPPQTVRAATAAYLESEDAITAWVDEACERDPSAWATSSALFESWKAWAERAGEQPGTTKRFVQTLEARGFASVRKMNGRGFNGLRLRP